MIDLAEGVQRPQRISRPPTPQVRMGTGIRISSDELEAMDGNFDLMISWRWAPFSIPVI